MQENTSALLLELLEELDVSGIPSNVLGKEGVWKVIFKIPNQDTEFLEILKLFLEKEEPDGLGDVPSPWA